MNCVRNVTKDLYWVGANDRRLTLFENIYPIAKGVSYNSYLLMDEKTVLFDTVDWSACRQFLENIAYVLEGKSLDYLIVNHMEPDHAACIEQILLHYPNVRIICTAKAHVMMKQFGFHAGDEVEEVKEGDTRNFGTHEVMFVEAPMVHWPETMVTFDTTNGVLFSADAFGTFGALNGKLFNDEVDFKRDWIDDARRYFTNIVGKYGTHVQALLKKAATIDIKMICPLHGPVWRNDLEYFIEKYDKWSRYEPEEDGIMIVYSSMYGNTEAAAEKIASTLVEKGIKEVVLYDVSTTHLSQLISETFHYSHIIFAAVTYNMELFPPMQAYLNDLKSLRLRNRTVGIIENGTWASNASCIIRNFMENELRDMNVLEEQVSIASSLNEEKEEELNRFVNSIVDSFPQKAK